MNGWFVPTELSSAELSSAEFCFIAQKLKLDIHKNIVYSIGSATGEARDMAKGRIVLDVWKDHEADPFFWIELEGLNEPLKVYYGREGWEVDLSRKETRARFAGDPYIKDAAKQVVSSIDIFGPMDEILVLIEFAGYHGCCGRVKPTYLRAPKKVLIEMSGHLATLELLQEIQKNDPSQAAHLHTRSSPLERVTRFDKGAYKKRWGVVTGRHCILDAVVVMKELMAVGLPEII